MLTRLHPDHLARYRDIALLLFRYGRNDLLNAPGAAEVVSESDAGELATSAESFASDLEEMGATFVKIGQMLSTRSDLLPPEFLKALERLQSDVKPFAFDEVEGIVTRDLGVRLSKGFSSFDETPLACASLGQVHRATMRDGREVVVKVQRPGVEKEIVRDLQSLEAIAEFLDEHTELGKRYEFARIVEELRKNILKELDYGREARNLDAFGSALASYKSIIVPASVEDYCSRHVLTMEFIAGKPVTAFSGVVMTDVDGSHLADELFRAYLQQILVDGFFHADPHPGNILLTEDPRRIGLIDLGMTGQVPENLREQLARFLIEVSQGNSSGAAEIVIRMGTQRDGFDKDGFLAAVTSIIQTYRTQNVGDMQIGQLVMEVTAACAENGLRIPESVIMLGKTLLNLDRVGKALDPNFDPNEAIRKYAGAILRDQLQDQFSISQLLGSMQDTRELVTGNAVQAEPNSGYSCQ
ncbi:MAG: ubiquinone biosynthesis protein [Verrucomicrobiales bacterium]|jgi:ubiquinone biosynthesis protein